MTRCATPPNAQGVQLYFWSDCPCIDRERVAQEEAVKAALRRQRERDAALLGGTGRITRYRLDTFDPHRIPAGRSGHPYTIASAWLAEALDAGRSRRDSGPAPALYFYSPTKGTGKTHLAAALVWEAQAASDHRVAFVEELSYLSLAWNLPFGPDKEAVVSLPAEVAWLTVIDDLGRREPSKGSATMNAWSDIVGRRYLAERWTIITSNYLPHELVARGTLDEASLSRLNELTRGRIIEFAGADQRQQRRPV